ncbi:hypothetical protein R0J87_21460, partial [Halomonas sp. SIMBA_159]
MPDDRSYAQKTQDRRMERSLADSAAHAKETSKGVATVLRLTEAQVQLTAAQLGLAESARKDAEKAQRFTT